MFEHVVVLATEPVQLSLGLQQLCTHRRRLADLLEGLPTGHRSKTRRPATDARGRSVRLGSARLVQTRSRSIELAVGVVEPLRLVRAPLLDFVPLVAHPSDLQRRGLAAEAKRNVPTGRT